MSTTFKWSITQMQCLAQAEGQTDVVITAAWNCEGVEASGDKTYASNYSGSASFTLDSSSSFTPFDQLTQAQVLGWVWQNPNLQSTVEANVQVQLDRLANPPIVTPPLPWATPAKATPAT
jgi:hypothetical protein